MDVKPAGEKRKGDALLDKKKTAIRYEKTKDSAASSSSASGSKATKPPPAPAPTAPSMSESDFWKSKLKGNGKCNAKNYTPTYSLSLFLCHL